MKVTKISMTLATAGLLALTPALFAQTNTPSTNGPGGGRRGAMMSVDDQMQNLDKTLKLTDAEKPKVKAVLEERQKAMQGLRGMSREDRQTKILDIQADTNKKMKDILTADQYTEWEKIQKQRMGRRNGGGAGGGGGGGQ